MKEEFDRQIWARNAKSVVLFVACLACLMNNLLLAYYNTITNTFTNTTHDPYWWPDQYWSVIPLGEDLNVIYHYTLLAKWPVSRVKWPILILGIMICDILSSKWSRPLWNTQHNHFLVRLIIIVQHSILHQLRAIYLRSLVYVKFDSLIIFYALPTHTEPPIKCILYNSISLCDFVCAHISTVTLHNSVIRL